MQRRAMQRRTIFAVEFYLECELLPNIFQTNDITDEPRFTMWPEYAQL